MGLHGTVWGRMKLHGYEIVWNHMRTEWNWMGLYGSRRGQMELRDISILRSLLPVRMRFQNKGFELETFL